MKNRLRLSLDSPVLRVSLLIVGVIALAVLLGASVIPGTIQLGPFTMSPRFYHEGTLSTGEYIVVSPEPEFVGGTKPLIARNEAVLFVASDDPTIVVCQGSAVIGRAIWEGMATIDGRKHLAILLVLPRDVVENESYVIGRGQLLTGD